MSVHIRRLVSGSKARLKDDELGVELGLFTERTRYGTNTFCSVLLNIQI